MEDLRGTGERDTRAATHAAFHVVLTLLEVAERSGMPTLERLERAVRTCAQQGIPAPRVLDAVNEGIDDALHRWPGARRPAATPETDDYRAALRGVILRGYAS
ncbi:hypothetical protein [Nocardia jiangsuensis]|uniref:ANTAR domain-containing protein n=1 Tax=Nocardia jiangsuensis TaxID=1691563 RepID=A0ABV8E0N6_9NOCA